jgi:hypothetical protein
MSGGAIKVIRELQVQATFFGMAFDRTPKRHAALVFLLSAGLGAGGAVLLRVIVVPRHILSPIRVREYRVAVGNDGPTSEALQVDEGFNLKAALDRATSTNRRSSINPQTI